MANKTPKLFGVYDLKISKLLTDVAGQAPTYDAPIDLPGVQAISFEPDAQEVDGRGDERILETEIVDDKSNVTFDLLYCPFDAMAIMNGGSVDTSTPGEAVYHGPAPDEQGEYFKIEALTKPRKERLTLYKVRGRLFPRSMQGGQFNNTTFSGSAIHTTGDVYDNQPRRFSLKQADTAMTIAGTKQVVTLAVAGTVTTAGNATVVVTTSGMTGSPKTKSVAVALNDSAAVVAQKVREALAADTAVTALWSVGGNGVNVVLTKLLVGANDATALVTIADGTSVGVTSVSSTITTAGQAAS
jgi:hypothetical protein